MAPGPIGANQRWHVQCNTHHTVDSSPSLMMVFDDTRYLFNCPENTTRAFVQDRISIKRLRHVFLDSAVDVQSTSGLGGLLLSIGEKEGSEMNIWGPEGTMHVLASWRYHTRRDKLSVRLHEFGRPVTPHSNPTDAPIFEDSNVTVHAFNVVPDAPSSSTAAQDVAPRDRKRSLSRSPSPSRKRVAVPPLRDGPDADNDSPGEMIPQTAPTSKKPDELDWFAQGFRPYQLQGEQAKMWRRMVIQDMFRGGEKARPQPQPQSQPETTSATSTGRTTWYSSPAWNNSSLPSSPVPPMATSYLVTGPAVRGRFLKDKAKEQGVPEGPLFGLLSKGESVTLTDGTIVKPESCYEPGSPPTSFLIVRCPSIDYIDNLIASGVLQQADGSILRYVFHVLGDDVLSDPRYTAWMSTFPVDVKHIVSSPSHAVNRITFPSPTLLQSRLSKLDLKTFAMPYYSLKASAELPEISQLQLSSLEGGAIYTMNGRTPDSAASARLRDFDYDESNAAVLAEAESRLNAKSAQTLEHSKSAWKDYLDLAGTAQMAIRAKETERAAGSVEVDDYTGNIVVTALGTGSAMPSKYRNVSATLLQLPTGQGILLDVGEGTAGQLARRFGEGYHEILKNLRLVFISHMHADHHGGLVRLLKERTKAPRSEILYIACPPHVRTYITDLQDLFDLQLFSDSSKVVFIDNNILLPNSRNDERQGGFYHALQLKKAETVLVEHRARCFGIVLEGVNGWKIVYSGDTKPCQALVEAGKDATLLIHEATIEDEMPEVAKSKGHSTFSQALDIAKQMRAKNCLLTHFSQRYPKFPPLADKEHGSEGPDVAVAFDLMSIKVGEFWKAKHYTRPLQTLFREWEGDDGGEGEALSMNAAEDGGSGQRSNKAKGNSSRQEGGKGGKTTNGKKPKGNKAGARGQGA